uniref:hypothetical protein n=1 Tax=Yoonia sp. TaxID=2212373 RepID=UPI004047A32C
MTRHSWMGAWIARNEPTSKSVQRISDRYRKPRFTAHEIVTALFLATLAIALLWGVPMIIAGASLSYQMGDLL